MTKDTLAATIKSLRQKSGLSQDKLAARADISLRHYSRIEGGEHVPTVFTIYKIAYALDLDYTDLLQPSWIHFLENPHEIYE